MREDLEGLAAMIAALPGVADTAKGEGGHGGVMETVIYGDAA